MSEEHRLVKFRLTEPALFFRREEDLYRDVLSSPFAFPHFSVPAFANALHQVNLFGYCALNL